MTTQEILLMNPRKKRKSSGSTKRKGATMARRKSTTAKQPGKIRHYARRTSHGIGRAFGGLSFTGALRTVIPYQLGMFSFLLGARMGNADSARRDDPSSWGGKNLAMGGAGVAFAAILGKMVKPEWGQMVLNGGINHFIFQLMQNVVIPRSETLQRYIGADTEADGGSDYVPTEYQGVVGELNGTPIIFGEDGTMLPGGEEYREIQGFGETVPRDYLGGFGDMVSSPTRLGQTPEYLRNYENMWS
jgi:hypothetical protein